jgi:cytochrome P450
LPNGVTEDNYILAAWADRSLRKNKRMWILLIVVVVFAVLLTVKILANRAMRRFYHLKTGKLMNSAGVLAMFAPFKKSKVEPSHKNIFRQYQKYGVEDGIYHSFIGPWSTVSVVDPEAVKKIALDSKTFPKNPLVTEQSPNSLIGKFLGKNIVFIEGQEWRSHRQVVSPAFGNIEAFSPMFHEYNVKLLNKWTNLVKENKGQPTTITVMPELANFTIDVLGKTVFGVEFNAIDGGLTHLVESYNFLIHAIANIRNVLFPIFDQLPTEHNRIAQFHLKRFDEVIYKLIDEARQRSDQEDRTHTLLDMMIDAETHNNTFDNRILRDNCVVFFVAGHETTASALGFGLYCLGKNPQVQKKLVQEIERVIGVDEEPTYDKVDEIEYLDCVIKEYMRLYPSVPSVPPRIAAKDTELCGFNIPKGTWVTMSTYSLHHSPKIYGPTVEEFMPERWQGEMRQEIPKYSYIPFSAGESVFMNVLTCYR